MPYCGRCGHEVPPDFRFCPHCGADLASPGGPAVGGGPGPGAGTGGGPTPGVGTTTMAGTTTRNPPGGPSSAGGGPSGPPGPATQPVQATAAPPSHRHRPSLAPGLFIAAAGFLVIGFAYGALAYEAFQGVTQNLTRGSTIGFAAGFLIVGVGLAILGALRARD